jgi:hypothetical protein
MGFVIILFSRCLEISFYFVIWARPFWFSPKGTNCESTASTVAGWETLVNAFVDSNRAFQTFIFIYIWLGRKQFVACKIELAPAKAHAWPSHYIFIRPADKRTCVSGMIIRVVATMRIPKFQPVSLLPSLGFQQLLMRLCTDSGCGFNVEMPTNYSVFTIHHDSAATNSNYFEHFSIVCKRSNPRVEITSIIFFRGVKIMIIKRTNQLQQGVVLDFR